MAAVEETGQNELEPTPQDVAATRSASIRPSIEVPVSAQKTPAARAKDANEDKESDELSPDNDRPAIKNPVRDIETPTLLRRLSERRGRSRTHQSEGSVAGSVILSIEEEEIEADELSFLHKQTGTNGTRTSNGNRNSSSGLAMATSITDGLNVSLTAPNNQSTRREVFEAAGGDDEITEEEPLSTIKDVDDGGDEDELSPMQAETPQRSRKIARKLPTVAEDDVSEDELSPVQSKKRRRSVKAPSEARHRSKKRRRADKAPIEVHQDAAEGETSEEDKLSSQKTEARQPLVKTTTNVPKKTKKPKSTAQTTFSSRKKSKPASGGGVIGITVYRRTESSNIAYDSLGSEPNPGITPADVLAQVSQELASNHITAFSQQARPDNVSNKSRRRQIGVMQYFRDVLGDTMFELQSAQLSSHVLASQLRAANRRKRVLREELMGKRREREELECEIDRVRAKHRETVEKEDRQYELVQSLRDIDLAVRKGREKAREEDREDEVPEVGIEVLVGNVTETLGLLGRIREWNGVLEESAVVLEGRA